MAPRCVRCGRDFPSNSDFSGRTCADYARFLAGVPGITDDVVAVCRGRAARCAARHGGDPPPPPGPRPDPPMTRFVRSEADPASRANGLADTARMLRDDPALRERVGAPADDAALAGWLRDVLADEYDAPLYANNLYHVSVRATRSGGLPVVHLSVRRNDRRPVRDWRHLQAIKDAFVGPDCEGVELFPAADRVVDSANQYHLWCVADPGFRFPFGYRHGFRDERTVGASVQEPLPPEADLRPAGYEFPRREAPADG